MELLTSIPKWPWFGCFRESGLRETEAARNGLPSRHARFGKMAGERPRSAAFRLVRISSEKNVPTGATGGGRGTHVEPSPVDFSMTYEAHRWRWVLPRVSWTSRYGLHRHARLQRLEQCGGCVIDSGPTYRLSESKEPPAGRPRNCACGGGGLDRQSTMTCQRPTPTARIEALLASMTSRRRSAR